MRPCASLNATVFYPFSSRCVWGRALPTRTGQRRPYLHDGALPPRATVALCALRVRLAKLAAGAGCEHVAGTFELGYPRVTGADSFLQLGQAPLTRRGLGLEASHPRPQFRYEAVFLDLGNRGGLLGAEGLACCVCCGDGLACDVGVTFGASFSGGGGGGVERLGSARLSGSVSRAAADGTLRAESAGEAAPTMQSPQERQNRILRGLGGRHSSDEVVRDLCHDIANISALQIPTVGTYGALATTHPLHLGPAFLGIDCVHHNCPEKNLSEKKTDLCWF